MATRNYQLVSPEDRKKLAPILAWARKQRHPHREMVKALMKRGYSKARANKIAAVAKDMALGTTKWREGGNG